VTCIEELRPHLRPPERHTTAQPGAPLPCGCLVQHNEGAAQPLVTSSSPVLLHCCCLPLSPWKLLLPTAHGAGWSREPHLCRQGSSVSRLGLGRPPLRRPARTCSAALRHPMQSGVWLRPVHQLSGAASTAISRIAALQPQRSPRVVPSCHGRAPHTDAAPATSVLFVPQPVPHARAPALALSAAVGRP
jgi:hypothetical protein